MQADERVMKCKCMYRPYVVLLVFLGPTYFMRFPLSTESRWYVVDNLGEKGPKIKLKQMSNSFISMIFYKIFGH